MQQDSRIERYISGQMDPEEELEFEAFFVSNPACLDQLELAQKLHQEMQKGMQNLKHDAVFEGLNVPSVHRVFWKKPIPAWSLAAGIMLAVTLPGLFTSQQSIQPRQQVEVLSIDLAGLRGSGAQSTVLDIHAGQTLLSFYIDTDVPAFNAPRYGFSLSDHNNTIVFEATNLPLNNTSTLYVNLGDEVFEAGEYQIQLFAINESKRQLMQSGKVKINQ